MFALVLGLFLATACGQTGSGTAEIGETTVRLINAGNEPRHELRYLFEPGRTDFVHMDLTLVVGETVLDHPLDDEMWPTMRMTLQVDSKEITSEGDLRYEMRVVGSELLPTPGYAPQQIAAGNEWMQQMVGMYGGGLITPRGVTKETVMNPPPGASDELRQVLGSVSTELEEMSQPFPEEPIGEGAMWQVTGPVDAEGVIISQSATFWLVSLAEGSGELNVTIQQTAEPQPWENPQFTEGETISVQGVEGSGFGQIFFDLARPFPYSEGETTTTVSFTRTMASGGRQRRTVTTNATVKLGPMK
jgi:hypothetical protein